MSVLFCDTDCELWYTHARELNLEVIRMPYVIDGEEKLCDLGEETDTHDFYQKMRNGASASTAGLNQQIYYDTFEPFFKKGEDILYIAFSSKLSGTFEYLEPAIEELRKKYPGVKFRRFDTLNICMGAGLLVYLGAKYCREHGDDIDATYDYLERNVNKVGIYFVVDDMKYLARGGRISQKSAVIGNLINIKPVMHLNDEGKIVLLQKVFGRNRSLKNVVSRFKENYNGHFGTVFIAEAGCIDDAHFVKEELNKINPSVNVIINDLGPVITCHSGPGTMAVYFTVDNRNEA